MLSAFKDYLIQGALVKEKYIPFYLKWVSVCYAFLDEPDSHALSLEQKKHFLKHLSKAHEQWQVKQADNALRFLQGTLFPECPGLSAQIVLR